MHWYPPKGVTITINLCNEKGHVIRLVTVPVALITDAKVLKIGDEVYARSAGTRFIRTKMVELQLDLETVG